MTDHTAAVLCSLCHYLKWLQACSQRMITGWSSEFLKSILDRIMAFQEAIRSLDDVEIDAVSAIVPQIRSSYHHLPSIQFRSVELRNTLVLFIKTMAKNPYLSAAHRDAIFEYCLDHSIEVPKFASVPDLVLKSSPSILSVVESSLFTQRLVQLKDKDQIWAFLDSCFVLDPEYLIHLLVSVLEPLPPDGATTSHILKWLIQAIAKDDCARTNLVMEDPIRIRDLCISHPLLLEPFATILDGENLIHLDHKKLTVSQVAGFVRHFLLNSGRGQTILQSLSRMASGESPSDAFFKSVLREVDPKQILKTNA